MNRNALLNNGVYNIFLKRKNEVWKAHLDTYCFEYYKDILEEEDFKECHKICNAYRQRKKRMLDQIIKWIFCLRYQKHYQGYKLVFITLTFNKKDLKAKKETRRRYVARFLKEHCCNYLANIDFGEEQGREHYHSIAIIEANIDTKDWGRVIDIESVPIWSNTDFKKVSEYILKLSNHSFKDSTKREKLIYSRGLDLMDICVSQYDEEYHRFSIKIKKSIEDSIENSMLSTSPISS